MTRPLSRLLTVAASTLIGIAGAIAVASPASAHHTTVTGLGQCVDGQLRITWTVTNGQWGDSGNATIKILTTSPSSAVTGIAVGSTIAPNGNITGTQTVPLGTASASMTVSARWDNGRTNTNTGFADLRNVGCDLGNYAGSLTGSAVCNADDGTWKVTWAVANQHDSKDASVAILSGNTLDGLADGDTIAAASSVTAYETLPGTATSDNLKVKLTWTSGATKKEHVAEQTVAFDGTCVANTPKPVVQFSADCSGIVTVTLSNAADATKHAIFEVTGDGGFTSGKIDIAPGEPAVPVVVPSTASGHIEVLQSGKKVDEYAWHDSTTCHQPTQQVEDTCDGLTFHFANPAEGAASTITLTPSAGEPIEFTLAPGDSKTVKVKATDDTLSVAVRHDRSEPETVEWAKPADCQTPGLPVTGVQISVIVGTALLLIAGGMAILMMARRRRLMDA